MHQRQRDRNLLVQDIIKDESDQLEARLQVKWRDSTLDVVLPPSIARSALSSTLPLDSNASAQKGGSSPTYIPKQHRAPQSGPVAHSPPSVADKNEPIVAEKASTKGEWSCAACTFLNKSSSIVCEMCESPKPDEGEWNCAACTFRNKSSSMVCEVCESPKQEEALRLEESDKQVVKADQEEKAHKEETQKEKRDTAIQDPGITKVAPTQIPVDPSQRTSPAVKQASEMALAAGAGVPIDPQVYPVQDVERVAKFDPRRTVGSDIVQKEVKYERGVPVANAIINEAAAVSAKLRNVLQVGGERPSSLHLFEEIINAPTVRLQSAPRRQGTVGGRPGENVSDLTPMALLQNLESAVPLMVNWKGDGKSSFSLCIETGLLDIAAPTLQMESLARSGERERSVSPALAAHAWIFFCLLLECKDILKLERSLDIILMPTVCADMAVAMADNNRNRIVVNLLAFQQTECCCDCSAAQWMVLAAGNCWQLYSPANSEKLERSQKQGMLECQLQIGQWSYTIDFSRGVQRNEQTKTERLVRREAKLPDRIRPEEYRRQLQYWTQRISMALNTSGPTGLYDAGVRARFKESLLKARSEGKAT